jgi:hypothetical protein
MGEGYWLLEERHHQRDFYLAGDPIVGDENSLLKGRVVRVKV